MSCGLPENPLDKTGPIDVDGIGQLADQLHAMAQPLTILRGAVGALQLSPRISQQDRRYVEMCVAQTERVCAIMSGMRDQVDEMRTGGTEPSKRADANVTSDCLREAV
jgi:hypothetical protein